MKYIYQFVYGLPFHTTVTLLGLLYIAWREVPKSRVGKRLQKTGRWKSICAGVFLLWLIILIYTTIFSRTEGSCVAFLEPFHQLKVLLAGGPKELIRSAWMNVLLFVPGGLLLYELMPSNKQNASSVLFVFIVITGLSFCIEAAQWHWRLGQAETDDIICNAIGALIGIIIAIEKE